jgi:hypothetical protein
MGSPTFIERTAAIEASSKATTLHQRVEPLTFSRRVKVENRVPPSRCVPQRPYGAPR